MKKDKKIPAATRKAKEPGKKSSPLVLRMSWVIILLILIVPYLKQIGKRYPDSKNVLTLTEWFSGRYQSNTEEHIKHSWAFKKELTELYNDLEFTLFNKINVVGFILGKKDYMYSVDHINSYLGRDYIGEDSIAKKLRMIHALQDTFKKRNIDFLVVYAPDKVSCLPQYLPDEYSVPRGKTNYADYIRLSKQLGVNYIDMESWFLSMMPKTKYPLFPPYGHHWSYYGGCLATDSVIHYIKNLMPKDSFPIWYWPDVKMDTPRLRDADILARMDITYKLPSIPLAYPTVTYSVASPYNTHKVLGIGDSYYTDFLFNHAMRHFFGNGKFWYYYNKVLMDTVNEYHETWEDDMKKEMESNRVIILLASDGDLTNLGWGFVEDAYQLYTHPSVFYGRRRAYYNLNCYKKQIRSSTNLSEQAKDESLRRNVGIDSIITEMARAKMKDDEKK